VLATQFGAHAVRLVLEGKFGQMVCIHPPNIEDVPIRDAVGALRTVDPQGSAVLSARALGINLGDTRGYRNPFSLP